MSAVLGGYMKYKGTRKLDIDPVAGKKNRSYKGTFVVVVSVLGRTFTTKVRSLAHNARYAVAELIAKRLLSWLSAQPEHVAISVNGKNATAEYTHRPDDTIASIKRALASIAQQFSPA